MVNILPGCVLPTERVTSDLVLQHVNLCGPLPTKVSSGSPMSDSVVRHQGLWALGHSPIIISNLRKYLACYPHKTDSKLLLDGFRFGFKLQYTGPRNSATANNLRSANEHCTEITEKILKEVKLGRIAGPFEKPPMSNLRISPIGLVSKSDGGWRLITHLSYPKDNSINDGIDPDLCSVQYTSFDNVVDMVFSLDSGALLAKRDIKSAFRLLPIHPSDFPLLGIKLDGKFYYDKMLPMGCSISCSLFEKFSTFLHWLIAQKSELNTLDHFLDDFILAGKAGSGQCERLITCFDAVCNELGVPVAHEKSVGPSTVLIFSWF